MGYIYFLKELQLNILIGQNLYDLFSIAHLSVSLIPLRVLQYQ
jgi:hypothetical protein